MSCFYQHSIWWHCAASCWVLEHRALWSCTSWSCVSSSLTWVLALQGEGTTLRRETHYSSQEPSTLPILGDGSELFSSLPEYLAAWSENPSLPCVWFITCNSYFMSLYYILLLFGVNLFSLPILIGLFLFSFPPPKKGGRKLKRSQGGLLPLPPLSCVKPQNFQHISALQFNILSLHIQSAFWKYGLQHCRSIKPNISG